MWRVLWPVLHVVCISQVYMYVLDKLLCVLRYPSERFQWQPSNLHVSATEYLFIIIIFDDDDGRCGWRKRIIVAEALLFAFLYVYSETYKHTSTFFLYAIVSRFRALSLFLSWLDIKFLLPPFSFSKALLFLCAQLVPAAAPRYAVLGEIRASRRWFCSMQRENTVCISIIRNS